MSQSRRAIREQWRQRIAQQRSGGQSVAAFCRDQGVSENSFYFWRRRLREANAGTFVELRTSAAVAPEARPAGSEGFPFAIEIRLPGRRGLLVRRGFDRDLLIELVRTLEGLPSTLEGLPSSTEAIA
jgi:hypothetical protein